MHSRELGPFTVSALGLGCMNVSMGYGEGDPEESERVLLGALDAGYTFLDTAAIYGSGHNEKLIGRLLSKRRQEYTLASKCGIFRTENGGMSIDGRPETIRKTCEESLRNLQTDVIDLYYLHRVDPQVPVEESIGTLGELVREGKIQAVGLSEISTATLKRAHQEYPVTAVQSEYSLWSRTPERQLLDACAEMGVAFVPFSPLARAFLTGKASDVTCLSEDDLRCTIARPRFEAEAFAQNRELLRRFAKIAESVDCSMAQLALGWLLAQRDGTLIPIPGTKHFDYMQENAEAGDLQLDSGIVDELDKLINEDTVTGDRYTAEIMATIDSEKD